MAIKANLYNKYINEVKPELAKELGVSSIMEVPKIEKIVLNMGLGKAVTNKAIIKDAIEELTKIAGQQAIETKARVSNASFKIREGMGIGVKVTLRGQNMYTFLEKLVNIALPRIRDFRGINHKSFDGRGNFSLGINEHIIFPEIDLDKVSVMKGMDIAIVTSTLDDNEAYVLLAKLGMPFKNIKKDGDDE